MNRPATQAPAAGAIPAAFAVLYVSWGTTYLATGTAVAADGEAMPPALFGGTRLVCAGLLLLAFQALRGQSLRLTRAGFLKVLAISWLLFLFGNWLITVAQTRVPSGLTAVLAASTPLWMALIGLPWPRGERLGPLGWTGLVLGAAGVLLLFVPKLRDSDAAALADELPYLLMILGSAFCWAVGSVLLRHLSFGTPRLSAAGYQMLFGGLSQLALGFSVGELDRLPMPPGLRVAGLFLYLLVVGSLGGFVAFNWLLGHVPAAKVGTYAYVNPVIARLVGWLFGEAVTGWLLGGMAVILVGVYLVREDDREDAPEADASPG